MRSVLAIILIVVTVAACTRPPEQPSPDDATAIGDIASGRELYAANCAQCHGADLRGSSQGPPHIDPIYEPNHHADVSFRLAIARGAPQHHWNFGAMPPIAGLTDQDVTDIIAHVREQQRAAGIE